MSITLSENTTFAIDRIQLSDAPPAANIRFVAHSTTGKNATDITDPVQSVAFTDALLLGDFQRVNACARYLNEPAAGPD